jgi:PAS domain S-box-containing protein
VRPASVPTAPAGFGHALVEAARSASIGIVVAAPSESGFVCELASQRIVELAGGTPRRIPEELGLDPEASGAVSRWLSDPGAGTLSLDGVSMGGDSSGSRLRLVASRVAFGGRPAAVLFFYDSVVRRRAERALAESDARFRRLLDTSPDAVALGTRARFHYANPAAVRVLGYSSMEEIVSKPMREHLHPGDRAIARAMVKSLLETGRAQPPVRIRVLHKDGRPVQLELRPMAIEWDGEPALLGIARDLTERRRVQAQIIRADRLAAMGTLAAGVAHEINNPLAYLMLNLQYLMRELPRFDGDPARLAVLLERLAEAEHGARRVSTIVGDLRTLARPEQVGTGPVSVTAAVNAAVKVVGAQLRHRARVVESYDDVPLVEASTTRLEQVFVNLLANAAQAIPEGRPEDHLIRVSVRAEGASVIVEVSDTGVGIPPEVLGRVFDPFFTTKPRGVGTGLGLPISRGIVKSLGGEITVSSTVGVGTAFRIVLPALIGAEAALPRPEDAVVTITEAPAAPRPGRARVLVVDDEPLVADMLQRTLSEAHDVTVATDGVTALEYVLSGAEFDLIFCDLLMPRMSGMDLYDELRAKRPGVEERIVFMTGGAFTERAAQFLATVPNRKLSKPFDLGDLERVVSRAAGRDR